MNGNDQFILDIQGTARIIVDGGDYTQKESLENHAIPVHDFEELEIETQGDAMVTLRNEGDIDAQTLGERVWEYNKAENRG